MSIVPERLREARAALGLTKAELARKADITPAAITQFEMGKREPSLETLRKLAVTLKVDLDFLMGEKFEISDEQVLFRNLKGLTEEDRRILMRVYEGLKKPE